MENQFVRSFSEISFKDTFKTGYDTFFLGNTYVFLKEKGINIPEGFVISQEAYFYFLTQTGLSKKIAAILSPEKLEKNSYIKDIGIEVRALILGSELPEKLKCEITQAKSSLHHKLQPALRLAIRCGMHENPEQFSDINNFQELFLNISDEDELYKACLKCYAAMFADEEIQYRIINGIDHFSTGISICVQKMVRSDLACSGIVHGISPEKTETEVIEIEGCWGMMENITYEKIKPDHYSVPAIKLADDEKVIVSKEAGNKSLTLIYFDLPDRSKTPTFINIETLETKRKKFVIKDSEIIRLAQWSMIIGDYFHRKINLVWAKDGITNELFVVRAMPAPE